VTRAQGGDGKAFGELAERYYRMVSILAVQKLRNRADAEDVVQESFVRAYRAIDSLREAEKFPGWLYRITLKICFDHMRKRDRHDSPLRLEEVADAGRAPEAAPLAGLEAREEQAKIKDAIASLPDKYRLVVTLRFIDKRSYKEIAEQLGEPDGTVANRIHRAVKMLQGALDGTLGPDSKASELLEEAES
jgi:RNA polymerase sigma-70 factor (ECF subfamily)